MERSRFTIDLGAVRRNAETLLRAAGGAELWAVVKADGYGHGAVDVARAALDGGGVGALRRDARRRPSRLRGVHREARVIVMGPLGEAEVGEARDGAARAGGGGRACFPRGVPVHVKLDTGMGRWGLRELPAGRRRRSSAS